jgi:hypothetical protein
VNAIDAFFTSIFGIDAHSANGARLVVTGGR